MAHHFDELELLALIEGEISTSDASDLRMRLGSDPALLRAVDEMMTQRQEMRALGMPELPCDFVAELEPLLVRSMLVEASPDSSNGQIYRPGQARRAKQTAGIAFRSMMQYAAAAGLLLAASAGLWAAGLGLGWWGQQNSNISNPGNPGIAANTPGNAAVGNAIAAGGDDAGDSVLWPVSDGQVHHELTLDSLLASQDGAASRVIAPAQRTGAANLAAASMCITADFALLLEQDSPALAETAMVNAVQSSGAAAALVRNFSFEDATELETMWRATRRNEPTLERPRTASMSVAESRRESERFFRELAGRAQSQLQTIRARDAAAPAASDDALIAGSATVAADVTQQLLFSSAGATHTISIPVAQLGKILTQLTDADFESQAMLAMFRPMNILDQPTATDRASDLTAAERIRRMLEVRKALDGLLESDPAAVVLLPVVVQPSEN